MVESLSPKLKTSSAVYNYQYRDSPLAVFAIYAVIDRFYVDRLLVIIMKVLSSKQNLKKT